MIVDMKKLSSLFAYKLITSISAALVFFCGTFAFAAEAGKDTLQGYIVLILQFVNYTLLPLLFSIALLFFLVNAARYFIFKGDSDDGREKAKTLALYGIGAFVFLVSIWGIVNMFVYGLGIDSSEPICPDYFRGNCYSRFGGSGEPSGFNLFEEDTDGFNLFD
jgi:hypothetical protein